VKGKDCSSNTIAHRIVQTREPIKLGAVVPSEAAMPKLVAIRVAYRLFPWIGISHKVTLTRPITPRAFRVPVPRLHEQISVLSVAERSPARFQSLLDLIWLEEDVGRVAGYAIDGRFQRVQGAKRIHDMAGRRINFYDLRRSIRNENQGKYGQAEKPSRCVDDFFQKPAQAHTERNQRHGSAPRVEGCRAPESSCHE
jgi:hypothetical protein